MRDGQTTLRFVLRRAQPVRTRASRRYGYALPLPYTGDALATYGARVLGDTVRSAIATYSSDLLGEDAEPPALRTALPPDALQAAAFIARALERE